MAIQLTSLKGKHALITGSSRGIGRGIAFKLAEQGVLVAVHYYKNEAAAKETLEKIKQGGSNGIVVQADVTRPPDILRMFENVKQEFGKLDIFVSNARPDVSEFFVPPMEINLNQLESAFSSQAKAFVIEAREASKIMPDGGRIIAITYAAGSRTGSFQPWVAMGAAKAALESLVRYLAVTFAKRSITVNAISPGWIEDSVLNSLPEEVQDLIRNWHKNGWTPMRRLGTPQDIGNAVTLFCLDEAGWITGQLLAVDGGASLLNPEVPPQLQLS